MNALMAVCLPWQVPVILRRAGELHALMICMDAVGKTRLCSQYGVPMLNPSHIAATGAGRRRPPKGRRCSPAPQRTSPHHYWCSHAVWARRSALGGDPSAPCHQVCT